MVRTFLWLVILGLLTKRLDGGTSRVLGRVVDVSIKEQVNDFIKETEDLWGHIDILVNNAGGALHTPHKLDEIEEKHWDLVLDVNLKGAFFFARQ